jgi:acyl-CoA thioesterase-1
VFFCTGFVEYRLRFKYSATAAGATAIHNTAASSPGNAQQKTKTILFFGNSLTAGYGLEPSQAFPALIQQRIDSLGLNYKVINSGLSGETSAGGKSRISWVLREKVDVFVWNWEPTMACEALSGIDKEEFTSNY